MKKHTDFFVRDKVRLSITVIELLIGDEFASCSVKNSFVNNARRAAKQLDDRLTSQKNELSLPVYSQLQRTL